MAIFFSSISIQNNKCKEGNGIFIEINHMIDFSKEMSSANLGFPFKTGNLVVAWLILKKKPFFSSFSRLVEMAGWLFTESVRALLVVVADYYSWALSLAAQQLWLLSLGTAHFILDWSLLTFLLRYFLRLLLLFLASRPSSLPPSPSIKR